MVFNCMSDKVLGFGFVCIQPLKYEEDCISVIIIATYLPCYLRYLKANFLK